MDPAGRHLSPSKNPFENVPAMDGFPGHTQIPELSLMLAGLDEDYCSETIKFSFLLDLVCINS